jgi:hypothetical protein
VEVLSESCSNLVLHISTCHICRTWIVLDITGWFRKYLEQFSKSDLQNSKFFQTCMPPINRVAVVYWDSCFHDPTLSNHRANLEVYEFMTRYQNWVKLLTKICVNLDRLKGMDPLVVNWGQLPPLTEFICFFC